MIIQTLPGGDDGKKRWMLFVDGENFTIAAKDAAETMGVTLTPGPYYDPDVFVWLPRHAATQHLGGGTVVITHAVRSHYYTSLQGDEEKVHRVKQALWDLGFQPEVFKRRKNRKAKGVDIALTKDFLSHAFFNNYDVAAVVAGDGDYVPVVQEAKRLGKRIYVAFFDGKWLSPELKLSADRFYEMTPFFKEKWQHYKP